MMYLDLVQGLLEAIDALSLSVDRGQHLDLLLLEPSGRVLEELERVLGLVVDGLKVEDEMRAQRSAGSVMSRGIRPQLTLKTLPSISASKPKTVTGDLETTVTLPRSWEPCWPNWESRSGFIETSPPLGID